ncbi:sensor histidine kinase [Paenibacillaceae bacterium]|nr:sensor histidine kinase [Paenibacillaceae bacterium]
MGTITRMLRQRTVLMEFMLIAIATGALAAVLSVVTIEYAEDASLNLNFSYSEKVPYVIRETEDGNTVREYVVINRFPYYSLTDKAKSIFYAVLPFIAVPGYAVGLSGFSLLLYYKRRIKTPYDLMVASSRKIANNDLDFEIQYESKDEFGKLCAAFETMRAALAHNHREAWRVAEERKRLNGAFSHDLRTPLTVIKGHIDFLESYYPQEELSKEEVIAALATVKSHITRMERYVHSMSSIQRLEEISPQAILVPGEVLLSNLQKTASMISAGKQLVFDARSSGRSLVLDTELIIQVFENFMTNALTYTRNTITVNAEMTEHQFMLCVTDDGTGFSDEALTKAADPFFREEKAPDQVHFGLGLYICKLLCEKHGGQLTLSNLSSGGAKAMATFQSR